MTSDGGHILNCLNIRPSRACFFTSFSFLKYKTQASQTTNTTQRPVFFPLILFSKDIRASHKKEAVCPPAWSHNSFIIRGLSIGAGGPGQGEANFLLLKTLIGRYRRPTTLLAKGFVLSHCKRLPQLYEQPAPCVPRQIVQSDRLLHLFSLQPLHFLSHSSKLPLFNNPER